MDVVALDAQMQSLALLSLSLNPSDVSPKNKRKAFTPRRLKAKSCRQWQDDGERGECHTEFMFGDSYLTARSSSNKYNEESVVNERNENWSSDERRNYKKVIRQRRIKANARERIRVHTIGEAFDSLRKAVPSYWCNQKLSKLAVLRIASSYIMALASLNDMDYSQLQDQPSFTECVESCTNAIQNKGRVRKRKLNKINEYLLV